MIHDILVYLVIGLACTLVLHWYSPVTDETVKREGKALVNFAYALSILGWPIFFPLCVAVLGWQKWKDRKWTKRR